MFSGSWDALATFPCPWSAGAMNSKHAADVRANVGNAALGIEKNYVILVVLSSVVHKS